MTTVAITEIAPSRRFPGFGVKELWRHRELIYLLASRDVKLRYRQTFFGIAWAVLQPLATGLVFTFVFGVAVNVPSEGLPYVVFVFAALLAWQCFATGLESAATSLVQNPDLVTRVYFPRLAAPLASIFPSLIDLGVSMVVLACLMIGYGVSPGLPLLTLPLWLLAALVLAFGAGALLCALNVRYRDVRHTLVFLFQLWFFATPIVYASSLLHGAKRLLLAVNPMTGVIDGWRWALLDTPPPPWVDLISLLSGIVLLAAGVVYFRSAERSFADVI